MFTALYICCVIGTSGDGRAEFAAPAAQREPEKKITLHFSHPLPLAEIRVRNEEGLIFIVPDHLAVASPDGHAVIFAHPNFPGELILTREAGTDGKTRWIIRCYFVNAMNANRVIAAEVRDSADLQREINALARLPRMKP